MKKRIIAILLSLVTLFSIAATPVGAATAQERSKKIDIVDIWLKTGFEGGRHKRRVDIIE